MSCRGQVRKHRFNQRYARVRGLHVCLLGLLAAAGLALTVEGTRAGVADQPAFVAPETKPVLSHYRAALAFELSGLREQALAELQLALQRGYPFNLINAEPDLIALRRDSRFHQPNKESPQ